MRKGRKGSQKKADMTVEELKQVIYEVIEGFLEPEFENHSLLKFQSKSHRADGPVCRSADGRADSLSAHRRITGY